MTMGNAGLPLYYICAIAGLFMLAGGVWLIAKRRIYIDRATGKDIETEIEIPFLGKFKTHAPALVLFLIGLAALIYPVYQYSRDTHNETLSELQGLRQDSATVDIKGKVTADPPAAHEFSTPVFIYATIEEDALHEPGDFTLTVPSRFKGKCKILYISGTIIRETSAEGSSGAKDVIILPEENIGVVSPQQTGTVQSVPAGFQ